MQTFIDSIEMAKEKLIDNKEMVFSHNKDFSFSKASQKNQVFENEKSENNKTKFTNFDQNLNDTTQ